MRISVYLHVAAMNHWREVVIDLAARVEASGIYDVATDLAACIVGDGSIGADLLEDRWRVVSTGEPISAFEYPTLERLWNDCRDDPDRLVLYLHTKGVSHPGKRPQRDRWRRYMSYFLLTRWRECVEILAEGVEVVGTERVLNDLYFEDHFAGNFWWARGDYVAQLERPFPSPRRTHPRFWAEMWILSGAAISFNWHVVKSGVHWHNFQATENLYRGWPRPTIGELPERPPKP